MTHIYKLITSFIVFISVILLFCSCNKSNTTKPKLEDALYRLDSSITQEQLIDLMRSEPNSSDNDSLEYMNKLVWNISSNAITFNFQNNHLKSIFMYLYDTDLIDAELVYTDLQIQYGESELKALDNGLKMTYWIINDNKDTVSYSRNEDGSVLGVTFIFK
mgnify:CR=1 FL=1